MGVVTTGSSVVYELEGRVVRVNTYLSRSPVSEDKRDLCGLDIIQIEQTDDDHWVGEGGDHRSVRSE